MSRWLCILILACATAAHAAPQGTNSDDMDRLLADKGLLTRLEDVSHKVADKAQTVAGHAGDLVVNAMGFLGVPYKRGGNSAETGFDCSGFVRAIYEQTVGLLLPRRADQQAAATQVIDKKELQPGDLVFSTPCAATSATWASTWGTASSSTRPAAALRSGWRT